MARQLSLETARASRSRARSALTVTLTLDFRHSQTFWGIQILQDLRLILRRALPPSPILEIEHFNPYPEFHP